jgi:hypothetical protein
MVSPVSVWQVLTIMGPGLTEVEFCYTIRYVVRNGRSTGPVWSVRRTAVYQQYQFQKRLSKWILLQPSVDSQRRFSEVQAQGRGKKHEHPMRYHVVFLFSTAVLWRDYIMHLRRDLEELVMCLPQSLVAGKADEKGSE